MSHKVSGWQGEQSARERTALDRWGPGSTHRRIDPDEQARYAYAGSHHRPEPGHLGAWFVIVLLVVLGVLAWIR